MQDDIRLKVKLLKVKKDISYLQLAKELGIKRNSFYNWLKGYYDLSLTKLNNLIQIIEQKGR